MECNEVMQFAADHAAKAEELIQTGGPDARIHVEMAKMFTAMAREVRIGQNRHRKYHDVVFKPVLVLHPPALPAVPPADGHSEFGDSAPEVVFDLNSAMPQQRQDEALRLSEAAMQRLGLNYLPLNEWEAICTATGYGSPDSARSAAHAARQRRETSQLGGEHTL